MWYFSWILGVTMAAFFAILNGMWYEMREENSEVGKTPTPAPPEN